MKYAFATILLLHALYSGAKVVIRGKILNYNGTSNLTVNYPDRGVFSYFSGTKIFPQPNGNFSLEFECSDPAVTQIYYHNIRFNVFHTDNSKLYLEIDEKKIPNGIESKRLDYLQLDSIRNVSLVKFIGGFEKINRYYNSLVRTVYTTTRQVDGTYYSKKIRAASNPQATMAAVDSLVQNELVGIERLFISIKSEQQSKDESDRIKEFLKNEIYAFYGSNFLNAMFLRKLDQYVATLKDSLSPRTTYNGEWQALIEKFHSESSSLIKPITTSFDYVDYMENLYYTLKNFKSYEFPQNPDVKELDLEVYQSFFKIDSTIIKDSLSLFQFRINKLQRYLNDQMYFSPALLNTYYAMIEMYPSVSHFKQFEPQVQKLKNYVKGSQETFDKGKIISRRYVSISELVQANKGVPMLIDIWATWCHPCIEEFHYRYKIQPFIDTGKLVVLYISLDKKEWTSRWKENIRFNRLEGMHYRADPDFIKQMWSELKGYKGAIPRYALIDAHGNIYLATASRLSDGDKLVNEINDLLKR